MSSRCTEIVCVGYGDLVHGRDISRQLLQAFGKNGLGVIIITSHPKVLSMRADLLPKGRQLASLPKEELSDLEHPQSKYSIGWSCGKELLRNGKHDVSKGSWYCNPEVDQPSAVTAEDVARYPGYCCPNIPAPAGVPGLDSACRSAGQLIMEIGYKLADALDKLLAQEAADSCLRLRGSLHELIASSQCHKARLLHYFPPPHLPQGDNVLGCADDTRTMLSDDSWCGEHYDHSILTGLYSAMFLDEDGCEACSPDHNAGLYIRDRHGCAHKVAIPPNCIAFQLGETAEVLSGGRLQATSHYVRGPSPELARGVSRTTYAVFMQPRWDASMQPLLPVAAGVRKVLDIEAGEDIPFGVFAERKFARYYR